MRRLALLAVLALGCDDPGVSAKVADVLSHGLIEAQAKCAFQATQPGTSTQFDVNYSAQRLLDGSAFMSLRITANGAVALCERNEACATDNRVILTLSNGAYEAFTDGGDVDFEWSRDGFTPTNVVADIDTYCTGFNLEAFD